MTSDKTTAKNKYPTTLVIALGAAMACGHGQPADRGATATEAVPQPEGALPRCGAAGSPLSTHDVREQEAGAKVSVRGVLVHHPKWDCPGKPCPGKASAAGGGAGACCKMCQTRRFIVAAAEVARPYMSRARLYLREAGKTEFLSLSARDCDVPRINAAMGPREVIATGTFQGPAGEGGGSYLLDEARVCEM